MALRREGRRVLKKWKQQMANRYGLICMSRDWRHPLLWGHYADKHLGLCLGFDVAKNQFFRQVTYHRERPTLKEIGRNRLADLNESDMQKLLSMKFSAWKYESEHRAFCELKEKDRVNGHYFLPFSENLKLAQVIIGERSSVTSDRLASVLEERVGSVTSFKARAGFQRFEVVKNRSK